MKTFVPRLLSLLLLFVGASSAHASRLSCISSRVLVLNGEESMFGTITISGSGPKEILIRAFGPTLAYVEEPNPMPDPVVHLYDSNGNLIAYNDDWDDAPDAGHVAATMQSVTEYQMAWGSVESAILITLDPGTYTAVVSGKDGCTGVAHLDFFETNQNVGERFVNGGARVRIGPGLESLMGSFIISGHHNKRVLFRALGPQLAAHGVANPLADPRIDLYTAWGTFIASNDDWSSSPHAATVDAELTARGVPLPPGSKDSALLVELPPGQYITFVYGVNHETGLMLHDVFELP